MKPSFSNRMKMDSSDEKDGNSDEVSVEPPLNRRTSGRKKRKYAVVIVLMVLIKFHLNFQQQIQHCSHVRSSFCEREY